MKIQNAERLWTCSRCRRSLLRHRGFAERKVLQILFNKSDKLIEIDLAIAIYVILSEENVKIS